MSEYYVYQLNPETELSSIGKPIFENDSLPCAITFAYEIHKKFGVEVAVWQPKNECFRDYYKNET
jgi:hypothetical protein